MFDTTTKANVSHNHSYLPPLFKGRRERLYIIAWAKSTGAHKQSTLGLYGLVQTKVMQSYAEIKFVNMFIKEIKKMGEAKVIIDRKQTLYLREVPNRWLDVANQC